MLFSFSCNECKMQLIKHTASNYKHILEGRKNKDA